MILLDPGPVSISLVFSSDGGPFVVFCSRMASARCDKGHSFPRPTYLARRHGNDLFSIGHNHLSDMFKSPWLHKPTSAVDSDPLVPWEGYALGLMFSLKSGHCV